MDDGPLRFLTCIAPLFLSLFKGWSSLFLKLGVGNISASPRMTPYAESMPLMMHRAASSTEDSNEFSPFFTFDENEVTG